MNSIDFPLLLVIPAKAQGYPVKISRCRRERNRLSNFVLAGLVPAIHALERLKQRRGYADQVRARRLETISSESGTSHPWKKNFSGRPCAKAGIQRRQTLAAAGLDLRFRQGDGNLR
jgi:hypothetical protein